MTPGGGHAPGETPYINQMHPGGADQSYLNGAHNCAPTSLAMIAEHFGLGQGETDAQFITELMKDAGTTGQGTTVEGIEAAVTELGLQQTVKRAPEDPPTMDWLREQLAAGKEIEVCGMAMDRNGFPAGGHAMVLLGVDAQGNFIVNDPGRDDGERNMYSEAKLRTFLNWPGSPGAAIAISK